MSHEIFTMYATTPEALAQRELAGFKGGRPSKDGKYIIGGLGKHDGCDNCDHDLSVPEFLPDMYPQTLNKKIDGVLTPVTTQIPLTNNHPHYDSKQTIFIVNHPDWFTVEEAEQAK